MPLEFPLSRIALSEPTLHPSRRELPSLGLDLSGETAAGQSMLLRAALARLEEAEQRLAEQQERIGYLETLSLTDELTGLANRRGFQEAFRRELSAVARGGRGGVLVLVDLDGFKAINDTHGHQAGDTYLRHVGRALRENVRAQDLVARLGGDEFAVLLTRIGPEAGAARAAALADRVNGRSCPWQNQRLPLRASFGSQPYGQGDSEEALMRRADQAMYASKAERRRVRP
ncbi:GGDEF domain-containing protein [Rhodospirillum centenum]|nr:GGDEF domain-containing protein [Rhodospirillum centenum]